MIDLWWEEVGDKALELRAGCLEIDIASLSKAKTWWEATIWLPGIRTEKQYGPLDEQKADVEAKVQHWFGLANTSRPAMDRNED